MANVTEYLTLKQIVEQTVLEVGHIVIPVSAFGYPYEKLETLFLESIRFYEQWKPYEKIEQMNLTQNGIQIPDAKQIVNIRYNYGQYIKSVPKVDRNLYSFIASTKTLKSELSFTGLVTYIASYPVGYFTLENILTTPIYSTEDTVLFNAYTFWKKGTLVVSLDEGIIPDALVTVDLLNNQLVLNPASMNLYKTGQIYQIKGSGTMPAPLLQNTNYYIRINSSSSVQLYPTRQDALNNTNVINLTSIGSGFLYLTHIEFTMTEQLNSYKFFTTNFDVDTVNNKLINLDNLFINRLIETGSIVRISTTGTTPAPTTINTDYYAIIVDETTIQLATTAENALLNIPIDLTSIGSGTLTLTYKPLEVPDLEDQFIHLYGNLGKAEINLDTLDGTFYNLNQLEGTLKVKLVSKYKCVQGLSIDNYYDDFFILIFKHRFCGALGRQTAVLKLEGLPNDLTADQLTEIQADYAERIKEYTETRGDWWKFA